MSFGGLLRTLVPQFFTSQGRKDSWKGTVKDKKWFIRIGCLWCLQVGRQEGTMPWELTGLQFHNQRKMGRGRKTSLSFLSRHHASIISFSFSFSKGVSLTLHGQARSINYCFFIVCRERVLGIINLLTSLGRIWISCHHWFIVWRHVSCFCLMVLLLSKPSCFVVKQTVFLE